MWNQRRRCRGNIRFVERARGCDQKIAALVITGAQAGNRNGGRTAEDAQHTLKRLWQILQTRYLVEEHRNLAIRRNAHVGRTQQGTRQTPDLSLHTHGVR